MQDEAGETAVISFEEAKSGGYAAVRFNAIKHGILSSLVVLAHEDGSDFDDMMAALIEEHRPAGMTERQLVEELAAIIWRKRRVLIAEAAKINEGLKNAAGNMKSVMASAAPFQCGLANEHTRLLDLMDGTPEQIAEDQREAEIDLEATRKASAILRKGGSSAYEKAVRALRQDSRECWQTQIDEEEYPATAEGLAGYIRETLEPVCLRATLEARYAPAIKAQALGEGLRLQVGDIDGARGRVHIRHAKGNQDRLVPLPQATHQLLRRFWQVHRNPVLLFPSRHDGLKGAATATTPMDPGGVQTTLHRVVEACGLKKRSPPTAFAIRTRPT